MTHVRGDCPARVPNLGPGCEQTGENLAQALSPRTDGPALARRVPRRSGPGRRREAEPDPASDNRVARAVESCCGSAGPARRSGAATSESPHLGSRSGEQPREYAAGRVGSSARQRRNAPVRADGRTAARLARGAASPMGRRGLRLGPRGREECGRGSRRGGARGTPEARAVIESSESASAETPRGKLRPASAQIAPTASSRAPSEGRFSATGAQKSWHTRLCETLRDGCGTNPRFYWGARKLNTAPSDQKF